MVKAKKEGLFFKWPSFQMYVSVLNAVFGEMLLYFFIGSAAN